MPNPRSRAESQLQKEKLVNSYHQLLEEFSSKDLRNVGNYALGRLIGKGSFGKVYLATHKLTNGSKVVLKSSDREDSNLAREIHHHRQFLHPHIARLYEVIVTERLVWLVLEYCPGDELYNYLLRNGPMSIEKTQKIFTQLVGAVSYVHSKSCVHRDLKLENILLDKHGNVKLCDFGFTREYEGKSSYLQTFCGTICYSAPEMLKGEKYAGEKVDVWSLGIILYALIAGQLPFDEDDDQVTKTMILSDAPKYDERFPEDARSLINNLLSKRPLLRPSLTDILVHPFLAEHAPQQQAILKLTRPAPFSTPLEKTTLERMRSAGVNVDQVMENVLAQRCDALAGWWALLIEKEEKKEKRRERKRREREAEAKNLRRLSAASSRLERISAALVEVDEEGQYAEPSKSRGRDRRSIPTPQLVVPEVPKLPETAIVTTPDTLPPPPIEKDNVAQSIRSTGSYRNRPVPPPKERRVSRGSTLHLSASQPGPQGILRRQGHRRRQHPIISQLASLKHWLIESTKRAKSPHPKAFGHTNALKFLSDRSSSPKDSKKKDAMNKNQQASTPTNPTFNNSHQTPSTVKRSSTASSLAPSNASYPGAARPTSIGQPPRQRNKSAHRNSLSPSPLTPRNSYRRSSAGLRGRKSTSSSVSSIRTIHHAHSHSKTSSISSNSIDTVPTPTATKAIGMSRSPHSSVKVLPTTPNAISHFPNNIRVVRGGNLGSAFNESAPAPISSLNTGPFFARRKRSAFKGPAINTNIFGGGGGSGLGTPGVSRSRGSLDNGDGIMMTGARKSQIIEEEEETTDSYDDEDVEDVENFSPLQGKAPSFAEGRSSIDALSAADAPANTSHDGDYIVIAAATAAVASITTQTSSTMTTDSDQPAESRLLPAAEISEPQFTTTLSTSPSEADREVVRPPRSSSLREPRAGTPLSTTSDRADKTASPTTIRETPTDEKDENTSPKQ